MPPGAVLLSPSIFSISSVGVGGFGDGCGVGGCWVGGSGLEGFDYGSPSSHGGGERPGQQGRGKGRGGGGRGGRGTVHFQTGPQAYYDHGQCIIDGVCCEGVMLDGLDR